MDKETTLGETFREARLAQNLGLREFARTLGISPSYLSDIETDRRTPSELLLGKLSSLLGLDYNAIMARAGRFGEDADAYLRRTPSVGALLREIVACQPSEATLEKMIRELQRSTARRPHVR
jgi:transcriptional regulator with XRE-family HTH domain